MELYSIVINLFGSPKLPPRSFICTAVLNRINNNNDMLQVCGLHKAISYEMCVTYVWCNLSISLTSVIIFVLLLFLNGSLFGILFTNKLI